MTGLAQLDTKGYIVIPQFLNKEEVELLYNDYLHQGRSDNQNYSFKQVSDSVKPIIYKKIKELLVLIKEQTSLDVDLIVPGADYINSDLINFPWHQDHESFYSLQQNSNYLNFYIPVFKKYANKSGLQIVPFTNIETYIPEYLPKIKGNGATRYDTSDVTCTLVNNDETGEEYTIPLNISRISIIPNLLAGDLLLLRGDMIHRTQDTTTSRISVSFRATQGSALISKERLLSGCATKQEYIKKNPKQYESFLKAFEKLGKDSITAHELLGKI